MVLGALAAVVAAQLIGTLWYSPFFLGTMWIKATFPNHSKENIAHHAGPAYAVALVSAAGTAVLLHAILVSFFHVTKLMDALKFAAGLASVVTLVDAPHLAFSTRSLTTYLIDHLYDVITLMAMATCIFYLG
ncbi:hypothetical protein ACOMHN_057112 [Nucella lapillus]